MENLSISNTEAGVMLEDAQLFQKYCQLGL